VRRHAAASARAAFESTPGKNAQARWLTLVLSALPHAIPFFSVVAIATRYLQRHSARSRGDAPPPIPRVAIAALLALVVTVLFFVSWMLSSGVRGWTVAFCIGKIFSEALIFALPIVRAPQSRQKAGRGDAPPAARGGSGKLTRRARRRLRQAS